MVQAIAELAPRRAKHTDGEFVVWEDEPIFKVHSRHLPPELAELATDGDSTIRFTKSHLEEIVAKANERIEDTGSYPVIVIGHAPDDDSGEEKPIVGYAGPFKVGMIGKLNPEWGILARLRVFKDDLPMVRKFPRLSVEYWAKPEDPTGGSFDAIALLGGTTPELDLGLRFSRSFHRHASGFKCLQYSRRLNYDGATAPCGGNTFVPAEVGKKKSITYGKENEKMLSQEDLQQIVEAMTPVIKNSVAECMAPADDQVAGGEEESKVNNDGAVEGGETDMGYAADDLSKKDDAGGDEPPKGPAAEAPADDKVPAEMDADDKADDDAVKDKAAKHILSKYRRTRDGYKLKYEKAFRELGELKVSYKALSDKVAIQARSERKAVRYAKLRDLELEGYHFEASEEINEVLDVTDAQFERHCNRIKTKYSKIPLSDIVRLKAQPHVPSGDANDDMAKRINYSKTARKRVEDARAAGKEMSYEAAYEAVKAETNGAAV